MKTLKLSLILSLLASSAMAEKEAWLRQAEWGILFNQVRHIRATLDDGKEKFACYLFGTHVRGRQVWAIDHAGFVSSPAGKSVRRFLDEADALTNDMLWFCDDRKDLREAKAALERYSLRFEVSASR